MESSTLMLSFLLFLLSLFHSTAAKDVTAHKAYIVRVRLPKDSAPTDREALEEWYISFFPSAAASAKSRFIYIYSDAITGFAAKLADDELKYMEKKEGFLTVYEDGLLPLMPKFNKRMKGDQLELPNFCKTACKYSKALSS